jgi:predicted N-formylglutamate amidohydrolase
MNGGQVSGAIVPEAVKVTNREGESPYVLVCDHASNFLPAAFGDLGLDAADLVRHIAWDPGAQPVAYRMSDVLDAVLIEACISRLVVDCNRPLDAPDLIPSLSETTQIPGNAYLSDDERRARIDLSWEPFHAAIEEVVDERLAVGRETRLVSVHSFTPVYRGKDRPWQIGIIHDDDRRLAGPLVEALKATKRLVVGVNQPYSPADRVYFTLERHARSRGLPCAMIEIRNNEIAGAATQREWGDRLATILATLPLATDAGEQAPRAAMKGR